MNNDHLKLSIVMSCYNAEGTLRRAINSILNQTFSAFEFIIIDDASTDQTKAILDEFAAIDSRIQLVQNQINQGLSYSLNKSIKTAKTPFIARMDADDYAYPDRMLKQYEFLQAHPQVDILGSAVRYIDQDGRQLKNVTLPSKHSDIIKRVFKKTLVLHPTIMLKKEVYDNYGYYNPNLRWAEDADLWYRIYDRVTFHNLSEVLLDYTLKSTINRRILWKNMSVKWKNLHKRGLVLSHLHHIIGDLITLSIRRVKNY